MVEIKKQLTDRTGIAVVKYLDETYRDQSKELVDKAIKELAPYFMAGMIENFAASAVNGLKNQLQNKGIYL